jgi:HK97 family phage major capsid protein
MSAPISISRARGLTLNEDRVFGLAIRFGSPAEKDRERQYFDAGTQLYLDHYIPGAPVWLSHLIDYARSTPDRVAFLEDSTPIGEMVDYRVTPEGVWVTTQLTLAHDDPRYAPLVEALRAGKMRYSSDSIQHLVNPRVEADGRIAVWPLAGLSIVNREFAAEPRQPPLAARGHFPRVFYRALKAAFPSEAAQRAPHGALYLVQQHAPDWDAPAQRVPAQPTNQTTQTQVKQTISRTSRRRTIMPTKKRHTLPPGAAKATLDAINAVVRQAAELMEIEPTPAALARVLQAGPGADGADKMDEASQGRFNELLLELAQLLGVPGDEPSIDAIIEALRYLQQGGESGAEPEAQAVPPDAAAQAAPPAKAVIEGMVIQPATLDPTAFQRMVQEAVTEALAPPAQEAAKAQASPSAQPQAEDDANGAPAARSLRLADLVGAGAKAAALALTQQAHAAPPAAPVPAGASTVTGAFLAPDRDGPASKAWHLKRKAQPMSYKAILNAIHDGPEAAKALGISANEHGAFVLPVTQAQEIIDLLYDQMVATALGADFEQMATMEMNVPKMLSGASAFYIADNEAAVESQTRWGQVTLRLKRLTAMTRISNRWLKYATGPRAEQKVRDDLVKCVRLRQDLDVLRGAGSVPSSSDSGAAPLGVRFAEGVEKLDLAGEAPTLETLQAMVLHLQRHNIEDDGSYGWAMNPLTHALFVNMKDGDGNPVLRESWAEGAKMTLLGYPVKLTNAIPLNLGSKGLPTASGSYTEFYFGRWSDLVVGIGQDVRLSTTVERYWEYDQTGVRVDVDWDAVLFRSESFVVAHGCATNVPGE